MQKFQNLSTKTKVTIATVAIAGVIGGASLAVSPLIIQHQETPFTPSPSPTQCVLFQPEPRGGGRGQCLDQWMTPSPSVTPDMSNTQP